MRESLDGSILADSIPKAREQVEFAAKFIRSQSGAADWPRHRPVVELIYYLGQVDYETKALLHRALQEPENRVIWVKYLALSLNEAMVTLPNMIGKLVQYLAKSPSDRLGGGAVQAAAQRYREAVKHINTDSDFQEAIKLVRNGVAAHHQAKGGKGLDPSVAWMASSADHIEQGMGLDRSQFVEYALAVGRAVQDLSDDLQAALSNRPTIPRIP